MPEINLTSILISALIPLFVGAVWYHPKVMGTAIARENNSIDKPRGHKPIVYIMTFIGSILIAMLIAAILSTHSTDEKTLIHGFFHGTMASIFMAIPPFMVISLFEDKSVKYILIHALYWMISMGIMGAIIGYLA